MAGALIGALRVSLSAETTAFEAGMKRSQRQAQTTASSINKSLSSIKSGLTGFASALTVGFLAKQITDALEYAGSLGEVSQQLGVTTRDLQVFRFAAGQVGVSQEQLETGLSKLTITLGKVAAGAEAPAKALNAIGISADQVKGKDTGEALRLIADGLEKVTDRSQRAAVEVALFGKSGAMLDNLLSGGSSALNELAKAAEKLGIVLSDEQIRHADETADKLRAVKTVLEAQIAGVVANNANAILGLANALGTLTGEILKFLSSNPQTALAIIGGLLGGRVGGLPGAVLGGAGGAILGSRMAQSAADSNMDVRFRIKKLQEARDEVNARRAASNNKGSLISIRHGSGGGGTVETAFREWQRQLGLLQQAIAVSKTGKGNVAAGVDVPKFLAGSGPKPKKGPKDRSDDVAFQIEQEQIRADMDVLSAKQDLSQSATERADIELQLIELERQSRDAEIDQQVARAQQDFADGRITKATLDEVTASAAILKEKNDKAARLRGDAVIEERNRQVEEDTFKAADQERQFHLDSLKFADQMATTQGDHRKIQLEILDAEIEQKRLELEHEKQLAIRNGATQQEIDAIQARIDHLGTERAQGAATIAQGTRNPLEEWAASVPQTAQEITEAFQKIEADGLDRLADGLTDVIMGTKSLKAAMHEVAASFIADAIKMILKMFLLRVLFGGLGGGGGIGGYGAYASGVLSGNIPLTGVYAAGGFVSGPGTGTSDSVPAMLSNGEFVVNAAATRRFLPFLDQINKGAMAFAGGGLVLPRASYGASMGFPDHDAMMPRVSIEMHNDFRGADPSAVAAISARIDRMQEEFPGNVVKAWTDARQRHFIR